MGLSMQTAILGCTGSQAGMHGVAGWDARGCRLGCTGLQAVDHGVLDAGDAQ